MKFQTHFRRNERDHEVNTMPSLTIPDQSLTVTQLIARHTRGQSLMGKLPVFESEDDVQLPPDWERMDISEKHEWIDEQAETVKDLQDSLNKRRADLLKKQRDKEIDEAVEAKLKAIREQKRGEREQGEIPFEEVK